MNFYIKIVIQNGLLEAANINIYLFFPLKMLKYEYYFPLNLSFNKSLFHYLNLQRKILSIFFFLCVSNNRIKWKKNASIYYD